MGGGGVEAAVYVGRGCVEAAVYVGEGSRGGEEAACGLETSVGGARVGWGRQSVMGGEYVCNN